MKYLFLSAAPLIFPCMVLAQTVTVVTPEAAPSPAVVAEEVVKSEAVEPAKEQPAPELGKHRMKLAKMYAFMTSNGLTHEQVVSVVKAKHELKSMKKLAMSRIVLEKAGLDAAMIEKLITAKKAKMADKLERKLKKLDELKNAAPAAAPADVPAVE